MSDIYTGIELGTDSVKLVVVEKNKDKFNVLASTSYLSSGIKDGQVVDVKAAINSIKGAVFQVNNMLGIEIKKVIAAVSPTNCKMDIVVGTVDVLDSSAVTGEDVSRVLNKVISSHRNENYEIVTLSPISFIVDEKENIKDPKGIAGTTLEAKVVIGSVPKEPLYKILEAFAGAGLETIDVAFTSTGDYYASKGNGVDTYVGAVINIGESSTNISVFNKGIQIKHSLLPVGSVNVDKDIAYIYNINQDDARKIKENFSVAYSEYADEVESINVLAVDGVKKELTQVGVSKVAEARISEILKLSKNEIKNLTNREISYIIITGGLSELQGFDYLVDSQFNGLAKVCKISTMGIRHNKYSSAYGVLKYFDEKLLLRDKKYDMVDIDVRNDMASNENKLSNYNDFSEIYGHLFD